jgi:undecaprenyl-diphosphatase
MIAFFWRDWLRIIGAFFASLWHVIAPEPGTRRFEPQGTDQILAWMIIIATIPVGIAGLLLEHTFRTVFSKPILTSSFLFVNGLILLAGEARRRRGAAAESAQVAADQQLVAQRQTASVAAGGRGAVGGGRHSSGQRALKQEQAGLAVAADRRLTGLGFVSAFFLGAAQILALLPGISRDGTVMVGGMFRGLTRQDAARFSFLLSAPVIFAAGLLKIKDLTGPLGAGIRGQVLFGSLLSFIGAYLALRFLVSYLSKSSRTLTPFAIYCLVAGAGAFVFLNIR